MPAIDPNDKAAVDALAREMRFQMSPPLDLVKVGGVWRLPIVSYHATQWFNLMPIRDHDRIVAWDIGA